MADTITFTEVPVAKRHLQPVSLFHLVTRHGIDVSKFAEWEAKCCGCICNVCNNPGGHTSSRDARHHPECTENFIERHMDLSRYQHP